MSTRCYYLLVIRIKPESIGRWNYCPIRPIKSNDLDAFIVEQMIVRVVSGIDVSR